MLTAVGARDFLWCQFIFYFSFHFIFLCHMSTSSSSCSFNSDRMIIIIIRNLYSAIMPIGGYRGAGGTGR